MINIPKLLIYNELDDVAIYIKDIAAQFKLNSDAINWIDSNEYSDIHNALFQITIIEELKIYVINLDHFLKDKSLKKEVIEIILRLHKDPISNLVYFYTKYKSELMKNIFKEVFMLDPLNEKNKLDFIKRTLNKSGLVLNKSQIDLLNKRLIPNTRVIENEIDKINVNNLDFINEIICNYYEMNPFKITELILKNDLVNLKILLDELLTDINAYHKLFNIISSKLVQLYLIDNLLTKYNIEEISKIIYKPRYLITADINLINSVSIFTVKYYIDVLYQTETDIRQNNLDPIKTLKLNLLKGYINKW